MEKLRCSDIEEEDCDYVAVGESHDEIKEDMIRHLEIEHGEDWEDMGPHEKMETDKRMEQNIKNN